MSAACWSICGLPLGNLTIATSRSAAGPLERTFTACAPPWTAYSCSSEHQLFMVSCPSCALPVSDKLLCIAEHCSKGSGLSCVWSSATHACSLVYGRCLASAVSRRERSEHAVRCRLGGRETRGTLWWTPACASCGPPAGCTTRAASSAPASWSKTYYYPGSGA